MVLQDDITIEILNEGYNVQVKKVLNRNPVSRYPICSTNLNIWKCGSRHSDEFTINISHLYHKCVYLPFRNDRKSYLCIPLLDNFLI